MKMKYIVTHRMFSSVEEMFVFNKLINHDDFMEGISRTGDEVDRVPISAGFIDDGICYGESLTLGLKSRDEVDTALYNKGGVA